MILLFVIALYAIVFGILVFIGLRKPWSGMPRRQDGLPLISIVIAARNEETRILCLLEDLAAQSYSGLFEVIVADDHSEDRTSELVREFCISRPRFRLISVSRGQGKKAALTTGIHHSQGEMIITLDADVRVGDHWLVSIANYWNGLNDIAMLILPVKINRNGRLIGELQVLEFLAISGITFSTASIGIPVMCNGANLAFSRKAWEKVHGLESHAGISSGDDMFLMESIFRSGGLIRGFPDSRAMAIVEPQQTWTEFFAQRVRWASKSPRYRNPVLLFIAWVTALTNFSLIVALVYFLLTGTGGLNLLSAWLMKWLVDVSLALEWAWMQRQLTVLVWSPLLAVVYPFYAILIPVTGIFWRPEWKGRRISLGRK